jgi:anti-sigma factor RsiW
MNSIEEKLWNYIDGTCTPDEHSEISQLIISNEEYKHQYEELRQLHNEFGALELDEPPMAFTYNVMEQIRTQEAAVPLKTAINKNIIRAIAVFFVLTILTILVVALSQVNWNSANTASIKLPTQLQAPALNNYFTGKWMNGFLFFDVVLGLFLLDTYLRKRNMSKEPENI